MNRALVSSIALVPLAACGAPEITHFQVHQDDFLATIVLDVLDADGDLEGGGVSLLVDGIPEDHPFGPYADLAHSLVKVGVPTSACAVGEQVSVTATLYDEADHHSRPYEGAFVVEGEALVESEPNDSFDTRDRDYINPAQTDGICGSLASTGGRARTPTTPSMTRPPSSA